MTSNNFCGVNVIGLDKNTNMLHFNRLKLLCRDFFVKAVWYAKSLLSTIEGSIHAPCTVWSLLGLYFEQFRMRNRSFPKPPWIRFFQTHKTSTWIMKSLKPDTLPCQVDRKQWIGGSVSVICSLDHKLCLGSALFYCIRKKTF